eukprot:10210400-Alexandrium_andersonii.AAC.1
MPMCAPASGPAASFAAFQASTTAAPTSLPVMPMRGTIHKKPGWDEEDGLLSFAQAATDTC